MGHRFEKHFSVEEANGLLPRLASLLEIIEAIQSELEPESETIQRIHHASGGNGGGDRGVEILNCSSKITKCLHEIEQMGVIVQDINDGIFDFPHLREDREVLLCWKRGEKTIEYWHEVNAGFKGRRPL